MTEEIIKRRYVFRFTPGTVNKPLVTHLIRDYDIQVNIWNADISYGREGKLVVELEATEAAIERGLAYAGQVGVKCSPLIKELAFDQDRCVNCGSCTSVCFYGALRMEPGDWRLIFDPEACVVCGFCVKACPLRLFTISREEE